MKNMRGNKEDKIRQEIELDRRGKRLRERKGKVKEE